MVVQGIFMTHLTHVCGAVLAVALVLVSTVSEGAVSVRDLIELSRAGLGDEILVALLEADPTSFRLDAGRIIELRREGISERVLLAMLRSARDSQPRTTPAGLAPVDEWPGLVIVGSRPARRRVVSTIVVPVSIFGLTRIRQSADGSTGTLNATRGFGRFMNDGWRTGVTSPRTLGRAPAMTARSVVRPRPRR